MAYDYRTVVRIHRGEDRRTVNPQVRERIRRIATDPKLLSVNQADLPTSLSALLELTRLREERFGVLREHGLITPELTAKRIRHLAEGEAVVAYMQVRLYEDGRMEMGGVVPVGRGCGPERAARLPTAGPAPGRSVRSWVAERDVQSRKALERGRWGRKLER